MSKLVRTHKLVNGNSVTLQSEAVLNTFYSLFEKYNKQEVYEDLELKKQDLWEMAEFKGKYNSVKLAKLIKDLTQSKTFELLHMDNDIKSIAGSIFVVTTYVEDRITIEVPNSFRRLIFNRKDINLMHKVKHKKNMNVSELDYYDTELKTKSKQLVLLNQTEMLKLKGKYNKRLYTLLEQWKATGVYICDWIKFKSILGIPKSYKSANIDQQILSTCKSELKKVGIKITKIEKIKKGRSIDKIKFQFKVTPTKVKKIDSNSPKLEEVTEKVEIDGFTALRNKISVLLGKNNKFHLMEDLIKIETIEGLEIFQKNLDL